jgi:hypothetical protein
MTVIGGAPKGSGASAGQWERCKIENVSLPLLLSSSLSMLRSPWASACKDALANRHAQMPVETLQDSRASNHPSKDKSRQRGPTNCEVNPNTKTLATLGVGEERWQFPRPSRARIRRRGVAAVALISMRFLLVECAFNELSPSGCGC